ncbi:LPXTG cell wall anchor domain-containing protein [Staphylococcus hominis]|uniref:LPXTG cell wall anchor domain-containing protein n=1 Tax=Staphylococcus hominis TaxID=1290 RepID=UPI0006B891A6|nr:LPXTG cell wall anchor domain-containing protein [Staphylococcus hominis]KPG87970.1 hypothetical protein AEQ58_09770 [Staphylococcus hominis]MCI2918692.1 LPXTG cell wall anchor domain-containing protein [Staphylococcus hominis]MDK7300829.1 LPXTG cell wall anchor domain-containing protein [Staphylococcus hominis]MDS3926651.1 LPXTG cell wall anchor domain-containing protein [Staphylococcus hominis]
MKKSKVLATTTLAGALLFTGVGATHNAQASEYSESTVTLATPEKWQTMHDGLLEARLAGVGGEGGGFGTISSYQDSYEEYINYYFDLKQKHPNDYPTPVIPKEGKEYLNNSSSSANQNLNSSTTNSNENTTANNTQAVIGNETSTNATAATDNSVSTQENNTQSTQTNEAQATQALPETGGQSNSGLVTIVASVLLAAGSLLAFRRTSNSK